MTIARESLRKTDFQSVTTGKSEAKEALAIDAGSTLALNALAFAQWQNVLFRTVPDVDVAWHEGLNAVQRAIELDRSDSVGYACSGGMLLCQPDGSGRADRFDEGLNDTRRAHELSPNDTQALYVLGWSEAISGNAAKGIEHLNQVLRNNPRDPGRFHVFCFLSMAYFLVKDYVTGTKLGFNAANEAPNLYNAQIFLAINYVGLGELEKAQTALEIARQLAPETVQARLEGYSNFRDPEHRRRVTTFLRIAAGLEDLSAADALR